MLVKIRVSSAKMLMAALDIADLEKSCFKSKCFCREVSLNERKKIPARQYDTEFKEAAVKLSEKLGVTDAARELGMPDTTLYGWVRAHRNGTLPIAGEATEPEAANRLADEVSRLKAENRELTRQLAEEREIVEILGKTTRFFAVSRKK